MEHWWNDKDREKPKNLEESFCLQRQFVHHKSHGKKPGVAQVPRVNNSQESPHKKLIIT